jgi:tetratricopeptide (TPR) repeat protein
MALDKKNFLLPFYLGQAHLALGEAAETPEAAHPHFTAAEAAFRHGFELYPQDRWLHLHLGWTLDYLGRRNEAESFFQKAVAWDPRSAHVHAFYAAHLHAAGKLEEAKKEYETSLKLHWNEFARSGLDRLTKEQATSSSG